MQLSSKGLLDKEYDKNDEFVQLIRDKGVLLGIEWDVKLLFHFHDERILISLEWINHIEKLFSLFPQPSPSSEHLRNKILFTDSAMPIIMRMMNVWLCSIAWESFTHFRNSQIFLFKIVSINWYHFSPKQFWSSLRVNALHSPTSSPPLAKLRSPENSLFFQHCERYHYRRPLFSY